MQKSESIASLAAALNKAQAMLGPALKDANNPFYKSKYADLTSVWSAASEPLAQNGLAVAQVSRVTEPLPYLDRDGKNQLLIGVVVETVLMHESGEWISGECYYPIAKNDAQGVGSAITYGRRYGLQAILGIVAEDDDGNGASHKPTNQYDQRQAEHFGKKPENLPPARKADPPPARTQEQDAGPPIDLIGKGAAFKKQDKIRDICKKLNDIKHWMSLTIDGKQYPELVWNSANLDLWCLDGFDTPLRNMSEDDIEILLADLNMQYEERLAMQGDTEPAPSQAEAPAETGDAATAKQIGTLTKLTKIKGKVESQVAEEASGGSVGTFANLTEAQAKVAIEKLMAM